MVAAGRGGQWISGPVDSRHQRSDVAPHLCISISPLSNNDARYRGQGRKAAGPRRDSRMSDSMIKEEILLSTSSPSWRKYTGAVRCRLTWVLCDRGVEANV